MYDQDEYVRSAQQGQHLYFQAMQKHVYEINAITLDLDVGRPDTISSSKALGIVTDMWQEGAIPIPSLYALSGRGLYLMWLLSDVERATGSGLHPPLNTPDNSARWDQCGRELLRRLNDQPSEKLWPDSKARSLSNWYKRPGTIDTNTGNEVVYTPLFVQGESEKPHIKLYDLCELLHDLKIYHPPLDEQPTLQPISIKQREKKSPPDRQRNTRPGKGGEPYRLRAREIEILNTFRGGLLEGTRYNAILYYFQATRVDFLTKYRDRSNRGERAWNEAYQRAKKLNRMFRPPLTKTEFNKALKFRRSDGHAQWVNPVTIANSLNITEGEAIKLDFKSLLPARLKQRRKRIAQAQRVAKRAAVDARSKKIETEILSGQSNRAIAEELGISSQAVWKHRKRIQSERHE